MKFPSSLSQAACSGVAALSLCLAPLASGQIAKAKGAQKPGSKPISTTIPVTNVTGDSTTSVATDPVGFTSTTLLANTDSVLTIPFTKPAYYAGAVGSINGSTITPAASPGFTTSLAYSQGVQSTTYYAIIGPNISTVSGTVSVTNGMTAVTGSGFTPISVGDEFLVNGLAYNVAAVVSDTSLTLSRGYTGATATGLTATYDHSPKEGSYYTLTSNDMNTFTVDLNGDSLSAVTTGTQVTLIPYWTLGTAFPTGDAGYSYIVSTGTGPRSIQTEIFLPDLKKAGYNLAPLAGYFNYNGSWRLASSDGTASYDDLILPPTAFFTLRNLSASTTFTPSGGVYENRITAPLATQTSVAQDNVVSVPRPVSVALNDLGLISSGAFSTSSGTGPRSISDLLYVYDNTVAGFNKAPTVGYYYYNGGWRLATSDGTADYGNVNIPLGTGFTIRKNLVPGGVTSFWQNTRTY